MHNNVHYRLFRAVFISFHADLIASNVSGIVRCHLTAESSITIKNKENIQHEIPQEKKIRKKILIELAREINVYGRLQIIK